MAYVDRNDKGRDEEEEEEEEEEGDENAPAVAPRRPGRGGVVAEEVDVMSNKYVEVGLGGGEVEEGMGGDGADAYLHV